MPLKRKAERAGMVERIAERRKDNSRLVAARVAHQWAALGEEGGSSVR